MMTRRCAKAVAICALGGCLLQVGGCLTGVIPVWLEFANAATATWAFSGGP
jgi:hypothetical protein